MINFIRWIKIREAWNQSTVWTPERVAQQNGGRSLNQPEDTNKVIGRFNPVFPESRGKAEILADLVSKATGIPTPDLLSSRKQGTADARWILYALLLDAGKISGAKVLQMMGQRNLIPRKLLAARNSPLYQNLLAQSHAALVAR